MFIENLEKVHALSVTEGAKRFLEVALQNLPKYLRNDVLKNLPILKEIETRKTYGYNLSNANLALALRDFIEGRKRTMSKETFDIFDAWSIAIDGMVKPNCRSNLERLAEVSEMIAHTPKYPNRCVHVR